MALALAPAARTPSVRGARTASSSSQSSNKPMPRVTTSLVDRYEEHEVIFPALDFVDGSNFLSLVSALIGINVVVLMAETDYPDWRCWAFLDVAFSLSFLLELVLRMAHRGVWAFFARDAAWGVLDALIVALGLFDSIVAPAMSFGVSSSGSRRSKHSSGIKLVRLFRLLRMLRFVKLFPRLMSFVQALVEMCSTMTVIFTFLSLIMICLAIAMTRAIEDLEIADEALNEFFQDVPSALFTLFRVSTQDDWMTVAGPLIEESPAWSVFFVVFIVFVSWTMISVLTAVASESMVAATTDRKQQELLAEEQQAKAFIEFLRDAFKKADADGNGLLDKEEFEGMMNKEFVLEQMAYMGFSMSQEELLKAWDMLDIERSGELTIDSFVSGLAYLQEKLTTRHVVSIAYLLKRVSRQLDRCIDGLGAELASLSEQLCMILDCLKRQEDLREQREVRIYLWHQWMTKHDPKSVQGHIQKPQSLRPSSKRNRRNALPLG